MKAATYRRKQTEEGRFAGFSLILGTCLGLLFRIADRSNLLKTQEVLPVLFLFTG
jgi:hypothetical protein